MSLHFSLILLHPRHSPSPFPWSSCYPSTKTDHSDNLLPLIRRMLYDIVGVISITLPGNGSYVPVLFLRTLVIIPLFTVPPRFIVGVREMYERDLTRCWRASTPHSVCCPYPLPVKLETRPGLPERWSLWVLRVLVRRLSGAEASMDSATQITRRRSPAK